MTVKIDIQSNIKEVQKKLNMFQKKHLPEATANAINEVGVKAVNAQRSQFAKKLHMPVTKTIKSVLLFKAKKNDLSALVFIKDIAKFGKSPAEYLKPMLEGGFKFPDKEYVSSPTKHTIINRHGNVTAGTRRKYFNNDNKYFVGVPKGFDNAKYGVWERYGRQARGDSGGFKIRKVLNLSKVQKFAKRFDFFKTINGVVSKNIDKILNKHIEKIKRR